MTATRRWCDGTRRRPRSRRERKVAALPGVFPDRRIRTYTDDPGEVAFLELLKKSEALELAANDTLEPVADGAFDIRSAEAAERAWAATRLMAALTTDNQAFAALPPEHGGLGTSISWTSSASSRCTGN